MLQASAAAKGIKMHYRVCLVTADHRRLPQTTRPMSMFTTDHTGKPKTDDFHAN